MLGPDFDSRICWLWVAPPAAAGRNRTIPAAAAALFLSWLHSDRTAQTRRGACLVWGAGGGQGKGSILSYPVLRADKGEGESKKRQ